MTAPFYFKLARMVIAAYRPRLRTRGAAPTGGTDDANYCYSVWFRHLVACQAFLKRFPRVVADFGPGDSLGTGFAALLAGVDRYIALDVVNHTNPARDSEILKHIRTLLEQRAAVPGSDVFPKLFPRLDDNRFPADFMPLMQPDYLDRTEAQIGQWISSAQGERIQMYAPWASHVECLPKGEMDLTIAHATMQYVLDLGSVYRFLRDGLSTDGCLSVQIDFSAHENGIDWFDHWRYSELAWAAINHGRPYRLSRFSLSQHISAMQQAGLQIERIAPVLADPPPRAILKQPFNQLPDDDLRSRAAHIVARRGA